MGKTLLNFQQGSEIGVRTPLKSVLVTTWHNNEFSDELKLMDVTKTYKKDDPNKSKNYRCVSVLFVVSKDLGKTMRDLMSQYVNYIITPYLCGHRQGLLLNKHCCFS